MIHMKVAATCIWKRRFTLYSLFLLTSVQGYSTPLQHYLGFLSPSENRGPGVRINDIVHGVYELFPDPDPNKRTTETLWDREGAPQNTRLHLGYPKIVNGNLVTPSLVSPHATLVAKAMGHEDSDDFLKAANASPIWPYPNRFLSINFHIEDIYDIGKPFVLLSVYHTFKGFGQVGESRVLDWSQRTNTPLRHSASDFYTANANIEHRSNYVRSSVNAFNLREGLAPEEYWEPILTDISRRTRLPMKLYGPEALVQGQTDFPWNEEVHGPATTYFGIRENQEHFAYMLSRLNPIVQELNAQGAPATYLNEFVPLINGDEVARVRRLQRVRDYLNSNDLSLMW